MEKLHAALEDAVEYAEPTNADDEEYKRKLEKKNKKVKKQLFLHGSG